MAGELQDSSGCLHCMNRDEKWRSVAAEAVGEQEAETMASNSSVRNDKKFYAQWLLTRKILLLDMLVLIRIKDQK